MSSTTLKKDYTERIVPALEKEFKYTSVMQVPRLTKIVINQGLGAATQDKKVIETAINELTAITGQKAVPTLSKKDIAGLNMVSKSAKPSAKHPQGGIIKMEAPIHVSNLNLLDPKSGKPTRVGRRKNEEGKTVRYSKKSGEEIK